MRIHLTIVLPEKMMIKTIRWLLLGVGIAAGAYVAALICWRLWMYNGVPAPPQYLHWFISADGEASYNLTEMEMFGVLLVVASVMSVALRRIKRRQNQQIHGTAYRRP
jgi:hypothetical protein